MSGDEWDGAPRAHGEDGMPDDRPIPWVELYRWSHDDILTGYGPMSALPLGTATVDRPTGRDGDLLCAPWAHPEDLDGGSPFWRRCPTIRLG